MADCFNEDFLICSTSYGEVMNGTVLPWLKQREHVSLIPGYQDRPLYCVSYEADNPVATVLIVHGFTENAFKYAELIWSLLQLRFSVIAYDQRGHGRSWRDDSVPAPCITHVDHFSEYISDMKIVCDRFNPGYSRPFLLFAHSMGGAVASLFLEQYPDVFHAAVLSSPMIAPHTGGIPVPVASVIGRAAKFFRKEKQNPFFMKRYSGPEDFASSCASDAGRFAWYDEVKASRTDFQNSVPSWQWSYEAVHVTAKILAPGAPEKITCPVLLFSAETDFSVQREPQISFIERVPQGQHTIVSGSRHEIFRSSNDVLFPWWHSVICFYNQVVSSQIFKGGAVH